VSISYITENSGFICVESSQWTKTYVSLVLYLSGEPRRISFTVLVGSPLLSECKHRVSCN